MSIFLQEFTSFTYNTTSIGSSPELVTEKLILNKKLHGWYDAKINSTVIAETKRRLRFRFNDLGRYAGNELRIEYSRTDHNQFEILRALDEIISELYDQVHNMLAITVITSVFRILLLLKIMASKCNLIFLLADRYDLTRLWMRTILGVIWSCFKRNRAKRCVVVVVSMNSYSTKWCCLKRPQLRPLSSLSVIKRRF